MGHGVALNAVQDVYAQRAIKALGLDLKKLEGTVSSLVRNNQAVTTYAVADGSAAGSYTYSSITVDSQGLVIAASSGSAPAALASTTPTDITLTASTVGVGTTAARADHRHGLDQSIVPTWTGVHTFSSQDVHNAGVSLGSSGRINSAVSNAASAVGILLKPSVAYTAGVDRYVCQIQDSAGTFLWSIAADGSIGSQVTAHTGSALMEIGAASSTLPSTSMVYGINFGPKWGATAGSTILSNANAVASAQFAATDNASATAVTLIGGVFTGTTLASARAHTSYIGGLFQAYSSGPGGTSATAQGTLYGVYVKGSPLFAMSSTSTAAYGVYIENQVTGATPNPTDLAGIRIAEQSGTATNKYGIFLDNATATYKAIAIRDTNAWIGSSAASRIDIGATEFLIQSTKLGFFNTAPVVKSAAYTPTNVTTDRSYDANSTTIDEVADVLGTLIADLQAYGLIA